MIRYIRIILMLVTILRVMPAVSQIDTLFYFAPPWVTPDHDDKDPIKFHVSSFSAPSTTVYFKQPASPLSLDTFIVMGPGQLVDITYWLGAGTNSLNLSYDSLETRPANVVRTNGVRIRATSKITVVYDEVTQTPNNPETFSLKGRNGFGREFVCPFQTKWNNKTLGADRNGDGSVTQPKQQISVVATQSNTVVWITPRCNIVGHLANVTFSVLLPVEGACYTAENVTQQTSVTGQNLSGSVIVSDKPVAVTVSDDSVNPGSASGQTCYDLMGDQIVPVELVGTDYIVNRGQLNPQTGEAFFAVATENFTQLQINGASTVFASLNKGDTYRYDLNSDLTYVKSSKNIYLLHASGYGCELGEALLPPLNCAGSDSVTFTRNNGNSFFLNVLCKAAAISSFSLVNTAVNMSISPSQFTVIPSTATLQGGPFYGAQLGPFATSVIPVNSSNLLFNSAGSNGFFAMGVFNGTSNGGTLFHYMSSFLRTTTVKAQTVQPVCAGTAGTVALTGTIEGAALTGVWSTSYQSGTTTINGGGSGAFGNYSSAIGTISTIYTVSTADTTSPAAATKTITLYLTSTGLCKNVTDSIQLVINQRPQLAVNSGSVMCKNNVLPIILNGTVINAVSGFWSGGNGGVFGVPGVSTTYTPSATDVSSGALTLSLTSVAPLFGCSNSMRTMTVSFINAPAVSVVPTVTQVCTNSTSLTLNGSITGITSTGLWTGGSGAYLPNNASPTATYVLSSADLLQSSIILTLSSTNNSPCVSETATLQVDIIPKPEILLPLNAPPICASAGSVALSGTITGLNTQGTWLAGGTGSIVQGQQTGTVTAIYYLGALDIPDGAVSFSLVSNGGICPSETSTISMVVLEAPVVTVGQAFLPVCENASVVLTGTVTGYTNTGIWSTSSATSSPGTFTPAASNLNAVYLPSETDIENGFVILTLSSTNNGVCPPSSSAMTASFIPAPVADFQAFGKRCINAPLSFSSTSQANGTGSLKYDWNFGELGSGSQSSAFNPVKTYTTPGQYLVTLTVTGVSLLNVECPDAVTKTVVVKPLPVASFSAPIGCQDLALQFSNRSYVIPGGDPILLWTWSFGDIDTSGNTIVRNNPAPVSHTYKTPGSYVAALTVTAGLQGSDPAAGCASEPAYLQVNVNVKPKAEFGMTNNPAVVQEPVYFSDFSTPVPAIAGWYWDFGDNGASTSPAPGHSFFDPGTYRIRLTVTDQAGCIDTVSKLIEISLLPQVPAAFSPNNDGLNDLLRVKGGPFQKLLFRVYNNWGEMLFETTDQNIGWDGRKNGVEQPNGVYVWTLVVDMYNNRQVKKNGDITIVR